MRRILFGICASVVVSTASRGQAKQQSKIDVRAEEAAIRAVAAKGIDSAAYAPGAFFWSGAYARPIVQPNGRSTAIINDSARMQQRRNYHRTEEIVRLEMAASGDMAYDFANFTISFDLPDPKQHVSFQGSALRVWKKIDGNWRVEAWFARPYDDQDRKPNPAGASR